MTPASLELSRIIYDLVGEYETEKIWRKQNKSPYSGIDVIVNRVPTAKKTYLFWHPAPTFSEIIRVWSKLARKKGWSDEVELGDDGWFRDSDNARKIDQVVDAYMFAPTEPEAMANVEAYLLKILK